MRTEYILSASAPNPLPELNTWPPAPAGGKKSAQVDRKFNPLGAFAFFLAVGGAIVSCIEGVMLIGWFLLPLAVILGVAALSKPGKKKTLALVGILVAMFGAVLSYGVFTNLPNKSMDAAYGELFDSRADGESSSAGVSSSLPDDVEKDPEAERANEPLKASENRGTREDPIAVGETISNDDWDVVVNSFTPNADEQIAGASFINKPPEPGFQYSVVNLTLTYKGEESEFAQGWPVAFVADDGSVYNWFDRVVIAPEPELEDEMYAGASTTGNVALYIPVNKSGVLRVGLGDNRDEVFVAVQ